MNDLLPQSSLDALRDFAETWHNEGLWRFEKELRAFIAEHGGVWEEIFPSKDKADFRQRALFLSRWSSGASYMALRHRQLLEAHFSLWIYCSLDCTHHAHLDGFSLPPEHPFWANYFPANGWWCSCHVTGCRNVAAAIRRGGHPEKRLPENWDQPNPETGRLPGIEEGFTTNEYPDLQFCLDAMKKGLHRRD